MQKFCSAAFLGNGYGMDPRVKPEDDDEREDLVNLEGCSPTHAGPLSRGGDSRSSAEIVRASEGSMIGMPSRTG